MYVMEMVSIIIPIFNSEKYLDKCLHSILFQSYEHYEVVLVDDCSYDKSPQICKKYCRLSPKFKYYKNTINKGVSAARNFGMKVSKGTYICFMDSDDYYEPDYLEYMMLNINKFKVDIAICDFLTASGTPEHAWENPLYINKNEQILEAYLDGRIVNRVMNKVYSKEILSGIQFPEGCNFREDVIWTLRVIDRANSIYVSPAAKYHYRVVDNSLSNREKTIEDLTGRIKNELDSIDLLFSKKEALKQESIKKIIVLYNKTVGKILELDNQFELFDRAREIARNNRTIIKQCGTKKDVLILLLLNINSYKQIKAFYRLVSKTSSILHSLNNIRLFKA